MTALPEELGRLDATAQAELVRSGQVSASELVEAAIERIGTLNPLINAVTIELFDRARAAATSEALTTRPFGGVPIVVKDTTAAAGEPRYRGMRVLRDLGWIETHDSHVIGQLRDAGFISVGRSNLPELAGAITTEPVAHGPCRNPWDLSKTVGGSSGGSAAAVAAGLVPLAHGTDGGGSVRIPASICGVVGLKPTRGRISMGPDFTDTEGLSVTSVLTRTVRDTAAAIDAIAGAFPGDPWYAPPMATTLAVAMTRHPDPLRIGVFHPSADFPAEVHADCLAACEHAAKLLESLGHHVEHAYPAALDAPLPPSFFSAATSLIAWEVAEVGRQAGRELTEGDVEPVIWAAAQAGRQVTAVMYQDAIADLRRVVGAFAAWWSDWDVVVTPTLAVPPYPLGSTTAPTSDAPWPDVRPWIPFTPHFNLSGQPAISLPLHHTAVGLPIGVQFGGALGREDLLISLAGQLEEADPWRDRWPPTSVAHVPPSGSPALAPSASP